MKGLCRAIDRGLYIVWRDWEDWYAFAWFVVFVAAVFGLAASIWVTVEEYSAHDWHVFGVYVLSEVLLVLPFGPDKTKKIRDLDGTVLEWTIDAITRHGGILDLRDRMVGDALGAALWGGGIGAGLLIGAVFVRAHRSLAKFEEAPAGRQREEAGGLGTPMPDRALVRPDTAFSLGVRAVRVEGCHAIRDCRQHGAWGRHTASRQTSCGRCRGQRL